MEERSGWLEQSLKQARTNIQERPDRLKPEKHRTAQQAKSRDKKSPPSSD
jgi:hypothetical protein